MVLILLVALFAICSLAVDYGRVQSAKTELRAAVDAAARYAASGISDGTADDKAILQASKNPVNGSALILNAADIDAGNWNATTKVFTASATPLNAVRVRGSCTAAKGNAVPLAFASIIGKDSCDISASAVATKSQAIDYALVGLDSINMIGSSIVDSYNSDYGPYSSAGAKSNASIASNGDIGLNGSPQIKGDADYGMGKSITIGNAAAVTGTVSELTEPLNSPAIKLPASYTDLGSYSAGSNSVLTAGNYYATSFSVSNKAKLTLSGDVTIYINGPLSLQGNVVISDGKPKRFGLRVISGAAVSVGGNGSIIADVYAPHSPLTIGGTGDVYGRYIGKSISTSGTGRIHYDEAIPRLIRKSPIVLVE